MLFGLLQVFFGFWPYEPDFKRAQATFVTPNTFATAINLFLLPCLALAVNGRGGRATYAASLWLFAGLLSTESRGGWLAFLVGVYFIVAYSGLPASLEARARWLRMLAGLLSTLIVYYAMKALAAGPGDWAAGRWRPCSPRTWRRAELPTGSTWLLWRCALSANGRSLAPGRTRSGRSTR